MSRLQLAALSLLISVATSTFESPKSSGVRPSSSRPAARSPPSKHERDRRATHWESRSNSNLDEDPAEDDRDGGRSRISYASFVEQRPSLGYSRRSEQSVKVSNAIDVSSTARLEDDPRIVDDCVPPPRKPFVLVTFGDAKKVLGDVRVLGDGPSYSELFDMMRCRRRINDWNIQEPVYVDEPGWIVIDYDGLDSQSSLAKDHDPFYVTRGKKSRQPWYSEIVSGNERTGSRRLVRIDSPEIGRSSPMLTWQTYLAAVSRMKRDYRDGDGPSGSPRDPVESRRGDGYLALRDKHSDILDILNEPFFISRGKKRSLRMGLFERNDRYAEALSDFAARKRALGGLFPRTSRSEAERDCDSTSARCGVDSSTDDPGTADRSPYRDRRGVMEQLLKQSDPFYVARGKRSMTGTSSAYRDKKFDDYYSSSTGSASSTERTNDDASLAAKH